MPKQLEIENELDEYKKLNDECDLVLRKIKARKRRKRTAKIVAADNE